MDVSDLFASAPAHVWQQPPPSVAELAAAAGDAAASAAAAAAAAAAAPSPPPVPAPAPAPFSPTGADAALLHDAPFVDDDEFAVDAAAFPSFAPSPFFAPVDEDPVWPVCDEPPLLPPEHAVPAASLPNLSQSGLNSPALPMMTAPPPPPPPPSLCMFETQQFSGGLPFAEPALRSQLQGQVQHYQTSPHQRSVSPSSNNNRVTRTLSRTTCHTSSPSPPAVVTSRVNKTPRKKRQSLTRASRTKSLPHLVVHPSRTQQPLQPHQPQQQQPCPSPPPPPPPPQQQQQRQRQLTHQITAPSLAKSPPPQLSSVAQLSSSQTPTLAATPSTTNSVQRSPPRTPYSTVPSKPIALIPPQQQSNSAVHPLANNSSHPSLSAQLSSHTVLTNSASHQSKSQHNTGSISTKHAATQPAKHARASKPRDKLSRAAKLLKSRTKQQLIEQMLNWVRASEISEDLLRGTLAPIDVAHYISQCRSHFEIVYQLLSDRHTPAGQQYDAHAYQRCKNALMSFKSLVMEIGRTFVEASVWMDVLRFCLMAAQLNAQLPQWPDPAHNKSKLQLHSRLEQFATRAINTMTKMKHPPIMEAHDATTLVDQYRPLLPTVAAKLAKLNSILRPMNTLMPSEQQHSSERPNTESSAA